MDKELLIQEIYKYFNNRDIDSILAHFVPDVKWPNGWEGGYVYGHGEVRDYWTRQWKQLNPLVTPVGFTHSANDKLQVHVHQLVKDLKGAILYDGLIYHCYTFEGEKIRQMDIMPV
jgi:hypothetical protein